MRKDSICKNCIHRCTLGGGGNDYWACLYILDTKETRPCPAGDGCTVFSDGKVSNDRRISFCMEGSNI